MGHRLHFPVPDPPQDSLELDGERLHYLARVLRLRVGDTLEVFDGRGRAFEARIERLEEASARLHLGPPRAEPARRSVTVIQGLPKSDKLEWVLQKCTELGASGVVAVATQRTVVKLSVERAGERVLRWQKIAEEAARQCGRSDVPAVGWAPTLVHAVESLSPGTQVLVLDEEERSVRLGVALERIPPGVPLALVVGPEGGLERQEVASLAALGGTAIGLGRFILRTETAALAALAVIRHREGELG